MTSNEVNAFAWESGARGYSRSIPNVFKRADGIYLYDENGDEYMDFLCGAGTLLLGHNHPAIRAAIAGIQDPLMNHLDMRTTSERSFVQTLVSILPFKNQNDVKVHFCSPSGSDAVEAALKLARRKTGRDGVFAFTGGYHGMSQGSLAISSKVKLRDAGLHARSDVTFMPYPYAYRFPAPYNTEEAANEFAMAQLKLTLEDDHSGVSKPAAIILEPIQGEGGTVMPSKGFMQELRALCDQHEIILICDEIQAGLGRCGVWFSCELYDIEPDIICISKGIGGGFPLALIAYKAELNCWNPGDHIGTFRGQQYSMTCGKALIDAINDEKIIENVHARSEQILGRLRQIASEYPDVIGEVRGRGLYIGVEANKDSSEPGTISSMVQKKMLEQHMVMETGGRQGAVMRLLPPLNITQQQAETFLECFEKSVKAVSAELSSGQKAA